jgi:hypothetical protein
VPDYITIAGVKPYDGRYELDLNGQALTTREWGWAKRYAGYLPLTIDAGAFADPEMVSVLAIVALHRAGKLEPPAVPDLWERFQDAPFGDTITFEAGPADQEDDDGSPPPGSSDVRPSSNGDDSPTSSETSEQPPSRIGRPRSDTSGSGLVTSVT